MHHKTLKSSDLTQIDAKALLWTRIFHVRPHSIGETRFFICEKLIFGKKVGAATYFIFILKGK